MNETARSTCCGTPLIDDDLAKTVCRSDVPSTHVVQSEAEAPGETSTAAPPATNATMPANAVAVRLFGTTGAPLILRLVHVAYPGRTAANPICDE